MDNRTIRLSDAIEAVGQVLSFSLKYHMIEALSALPAVEDSLQQCMNELNATKDALAQAEAEIALLESRGDRDWNDRSEYD